MFRSQKRPTSRNVLAPCAQLGDETAADEVAKDVHHVEPTPGALVDVVDARLVGNVTALHAHPSGMTPTIRPAGCLAHKAKEKE